MEPIQQAEGEVIANRYRLERLVGRGGMGEVWRAENVLLGSPVAIKLLRRGIDEPELRRRLLQEARAVARLEHPAIVRVMDVAETEEGEPFIVMEFLHGEPLSQRLQRERRIPGVDAVRYLLPILDALSVAHEQHIVHRDVKPENIFLAKGRGGAVQPKLLDFGVVKVEQAGFDSGLTTSGVTVGSPAYMSPEQAAGVVDIDHRSDIWSACVVLYELVTGYQPFHGPNYNALMRNIIDEPYLPLEPESESEADLARMIERGLLKDRRERWASVDELGSELARWLMIQGVSTDVTGETVSRRWSQRSDRETMVRFRSYPPPSPVSSSDAPTQSRAQVASSRTASSTSSDAPTISTTRAVRSRRMSMRRWLGASALVTVVGGVFVWWMIPRSISVSPDAQGVNPALAAARDPSPPPEAKLDEERSIDDPARGQVASAGEPPVPSAEEARSPGKSEASKAVPSDDSKHAERFRRSTVPSKPKAAKIRKSKPKPASRKPEAKSRRGSSPVDLKEPY